MRISVEREDLLCAIQAVIGAVTQKNTLPILSNILFEANSDNIKITATDLDIGITATIQAKVEDDGAVTVSAKRFADIIKELPDSEVEITAKKNNTIIIKTNTASFKILTTPKDEFPQLPKPTTTQEVTVTQKDLKRMLSMTAFAISKDETRYVLNGICFTVTKKGIKLIATDGRRLAIIEQKQNIDTQEEKKYIIPAKTTQELLRNLNDTQQVEILFSKNQVTFYLNNLHIVSRLIEGEFPDYKQAIPKEAENKLIIERNRLIPAIKRAGLLITPESQAIKLHLTRNRLTISKTTPEIGETKEEIEVKYIGNELLIGFNPAYLLEALKNINQEMIELELTGPEKPGVIRTGENYVYIVLPMQIS
jgi:DNA polymerase-3 subunit beta